MLSDGPEDERVIVAESTAKDRVVGNGYVLRPHRLQLFSQQRLGISHVAECCRSQQHHGVFDTSELLRKLGARKAAWKPDVTFDVDRLYDSGGALPASDIDLVVEEDDVKGEDGDMPSAGASIDQDGPVDGDGLESSVATEEREAAGSQPIEDGSAPGTQHIDSPSQCEATDAGAAAGATVRASESQAAQSSEAANLQSSQCNASEEANVCEGPQTDGRAQEPAEERADTQDMVDRSDLEAAPAAACQESPLGDQGDKGQVEQEPGEQGAGNAGGQDQGQDGKVESEQGDEMDDEEEGGGNLASTHEDEEEEPADDDLEDCDVEEEEGLVEGESQEGTEQVDDEEDLGDEMEEECDEDDEEAELLAAIQRERKMQVQLKEHTTGGAAPFCDGEAEQSEDEAVSSDEDMDDDGAAMSVEEIADMMKELREKGTGEEELAAAHAKWLEEQDSHMLKRLVRDVKRGFGKGRKRVQDDGDDWDQEDARQRRKQVVGENGLAADLGDVSQMTTAQMMRQYKRKLATIGGDDGDGPATPVRRTRAVARPAAAFDADENEDANLPAIPDSDSPGVRCVGRMKKEPSRDLNCRDKGPTLLLGRKKKVDISVKAHSVGFLPCMLGLQEDATARNNSSHL